jgi:prevent-host-death family protein
MESIGAYEAKTHLPRLLERVAKGERITITKHGVPVAVLEPPIPGRTVDPKAVIKELKAFRKKHVLGNLSLKKMVEYGRR